MSRLNCLFIFCLSLLVSCSSGRRSDLSPQPDECTHLLMDMEKAEPLALTIDKIVPIETDPGIPLIGRITSVRVTEDRIFLTHRISDLNTPLCAYDLKGNFLWSTKRGKGPGEILEAQRLAVSLDGSRLCVIQGANHVFEYSKNGQFLRSFKLPMSTKDFIYASDSSWILKPSLWTGYEYILTYYDGKKLNPVSIEHYLHSEAKISNGKNMLHWTHKGILFKHLLTDTILRIIDNDIRPEYVFHFIPEGITSLRFQDILNADSPGNYLADRQVPFQEEWFVVLDEILLFDAIYNLSRYVCRYDLSSGQFTASRWDDFMVLGIPYNYSRFVGFSSEDIVMAIQASRVVEFVESGKISTSEFRSELASKLSNLRELDNPILVFAR